MRGESKGHTSSVIVFANCTEWLHHQDLYIVCFLFTCSAVSLKKKKRKKELSARMVACIGNTINKKGVYKYMSTHSDLPAN